LPFVILRRQEDEIMEFTKTKIHLKVSTFETSLAVQKRQDIQEEKRNTIVNNKINFFFFSFSRFNTLMHEPPLVQSLMTAIKHR
jgi:hypothetical protein